MKKAFIALCVIVVAAAGSYFLLLPGKSPLMVGAPTPQRRLDILKPVPPPARAPEQPKSAAVAAAAVPATECEKGSTAVLEADMGRFVRLGGEELISVDITDGPALAVFAEETMKTEAACDGDKARASYGLQTDELKKACDRKSPTFDLNVCAFQLTIHRAHLVEMAFAGIPIDAITDERVLSNRLLATTLSVNRDPEKAIKLADRLAGLQPRNLDVARIGMDARFERLNGREDPSNEEIASIQAALERVDSLSPTGAETTEARLNLLRLKGDRGELVKVAMEYQARPETAALGKYYEAWAVYLDGHVEESRSILASLKGDGIVDKFASDILKRLDSPNGENAGEGSARVFHPIHYR